jgi:hypothetical protein
MDTAPHTRTHASARHALASRIAAAVILLLAAVATLGPTPPATAASPLPGDVSTWATYTGAGSAEDVLRDAVRGPDGTVYAVGGDGVSGIGEGEALIAHYGIDGGFFYQYHMLPPGAVAAEAYCLAVDANGSVVIGGRTWNGSDTDGFVHRIEPGVDPQWTATISRSTGQYDGVGGVVVDAQGDVYACGYLDNEARAFVTKYDVDADPLHPNTGLALWTNTVKARSGGHVWLGDLVVDGRGRVYACGGRTAANGKSDLLLRRIGPDGKTLWTRTWDGPDHRSDDADKVILSSGRLFVGGTSARAGHRTDLLLQRYDTAGRRVWSRAWDDPVHRNDYLWDMQLDGAANVYVVGQTMLPDNLWGGDLVKWSASGVRRWSRFYKGENNAGDVEFRTLEVDAAGTAWVVGRTRTGPTAVFARRYSAAGKTVWTQRYPGPAPYTSATGLASALAGEDRLFVVGQTHSVAKGFDGLGVWILR